MPIPDDLPCREFVELVSDYLEGALPEPLRAQIEAHLEICPGCALYLGQMRLTIRALQLRRHEALSPQLRTVLLGDFRRWNSTRYR